jgi:superfamily II DNA/RNA helicase
VAQLDRLQEHAAARPRQGQRAHHVLLTRFGSWDSTRDSKVNALVDLLRGDHEGKKVLVFSEYKDTADYVAAALGGRRCRQRRLGDGRLCRPLRRRPPVLPTLQPPPGPERQTRWRSPTDPIDVLVATDVLSEGQNLQDSHVIVNYDLPWAIIRLIQRAGRVDRVGQESDTVHVYLITHDKVEQQIHLRQRIRARLSAAAEAFGSDEQFFGTDDEIKLLHDFYDGRLSDDDDDGEGEADAVSEAWLAWSNAQDSHPS